jgi:hypothetical protein
MSTGLDYRRLSILESAYDASIKEPNGSVKVGSFVKTVKKFWPGISQEALNEAVQALKDDEGCVTADAISKLLQAAKFARVVTSAYNRKE